jgi:hypothetical protein
MSKAAHILLVGNDGRLLNERAELLAHFWSVTAISTFDERQPFLQLSDLVVLCHTVDEAQRTAWVAQSRSAMPARAIISLELVEAAALEPSGALMRTVFRSGTDAVVDHHRGPAALVSTIYELLNERGLESKPWTAGGQTLLGRDGLPDTLQ